MNYTGIRYKFCQIEVEKEFKKGNHQVSLCLWFHGISSTSRQPQAAAFQAVRYIEC